MSTPGRDLVPFTCAGCGARGDDVYPFRCPNARKEDGIDHVLRRAIPAGRSTFPQRPLAQPATTNESLQYVLPVTGPNPFVEYRRMFYSYDFARAHGMKDAEYVHLVEDLDVAIGRVDGHGFVVTPFARHSGLSRRIGFGERGGVWIKNETGNVSGSHKARHLMGIMIHLRVLDCLGLALPPQATLAIASCGNAALAAAVVARAGRRPLQVFVPPDAPASVVDRLVALRAEHTVCPREPGTVGDPCYASFQEAVASGALPFCCQGNENGLTIEGGKTIGYEMISRKVPLDRVVIQVGGGALASSVIQAFDDGLSPGILARRPRFHAVQTRGAYPLERAYDLILERMNSAGAAGFDRALHYAATHRSEFMWPWEKEPRSIAHGILDDETYDWLAVAGGMLASGGSPVVVEESTLAEAYTLARTTTGIDVDHTGAAGLAGLLHLQRSGSIAPDENVAVIFSGVER